MSIKVIVLDLSGTTFKNGELQDGVEELLSFCYEKKLKVAFVTNNLLYYLKLKNKKIQYDCLVTPLKAKNKKPSPSFIRCIEKELGISKDRFIYLGDSDKNDAFCASNAKILYFSALWANPHARYGIHIEKPASFKKYISQYLLKEHYWGWDLERYDSTGNRLKGLAVFDCSSSKIKQIALHVLKWGYIQYRPFILNHLIASIYLSQIHKEIDFWSTYPSHNQGGSINQIMEAHLDTVSKEFRDKYVDLFVRHKASVDSGASRHSGIQMNFENQISTVHLNPKFKNKLKDKKVIVLDDFMTEGFSSECARNLLYVAGVQDVVCIAVGKYGNQYNQIVITSDIDPFSPIQIGNLQYNRLVVNGLFNAKAKDEIEASFS